METVTICFGQGWVLRLFGRNALVRSSDRIEALAVMLAIVVGLVAAAIAGAVGTQVYDTRSRMYVEQAANIHAVSARAVEDSTVNVQSDTVALTATVQWNASGADHVDQIEWPEKLRAGERIEIWVDAAGNSVGPTRPASTAATYAVGVAVSLWVGALAATAAALLILHRSLDRSRFAQWDRELLSLANDDGGRTNHQG